MVLGVFKRVAFRPPVPKKGRLEGLRTFVLKWCKRNIVPLPPDTDFSFESWIKNTPYPEARKIELTTVYNELLTHEFKFTPKCAKVGLFMKDEFYTEYKYPRGIYARKDEFKVLFGPFIKRIEQVVFKHPAFIKYVPVSERPNYISKRLNRVGANIFATDFSSFEAQFIAEVMYNCEDVMYEYMLSKTPWYERFRQLKEFINGTNVIDYKYFTLWLEATRQSGEMNTSLGNGFSNLMFMLYICYMNGNKHVKGVVEGDDGAFSCTGIPPSVNFFAEFGLVIKAEVVRELSQASFCGIIYHPDDMVPLTDPRKVLASTGWFRGCKWRMRDSKLRAILRCKALSVFHQYNGCPILTEFALMLIRLTSQYHSASLLWVDQGHKDINTYERENYKKFLTTEMPPIKHVGIGSRHVVEDKFGIPVFYQYKLEEYFRSFDDLNNNLMIDDFLLNIPGDWIDFGSKYRRHLDSKSSSSWVEVPDGFYGHRRFNPDTVLGVLKTNPVSNITEQVSFLN